MQSIIDFMLFFIRGCSINPMGIHTVQLGSAIGLFWLFAEAPHIHLSEVREMASLQNPVIIVPGITASILQDDYPLRTEDVWSMVFNKEYDRIALHPDDIRYEAKEPAHIITGRIFAIYNDLIEQLRHELTSKADEPTPVYPFPYDWRHDIRETAKKLREFIQEVCDRTKLLRHYKDYEGKVDLVGHSMGGLLICEYLSQFDNEKMIGKIATLGTPYQGSIEALVKITTGMGMLAGSIPSEREREAARMTTAVYQLLPSFKGAFVDPSGNDVDIFSIENWQPTILESLAEYVRLHSVTDYKTKKQQKEKAEKIFINLLAAAKSHREHVKSLNITTSGLTANDWLAIVGLGEKTRLQTTVVKTGKHWFQISEDQFVNEWEYTEEKKDNENTGDATVPFLGAVPPFAGIGRENLIGVSEDDLGFFEIRERLTSGIIGFHGLLPRVNLVQRLVVKHFKPDFKGSVWGKPVPGAFDNWSPPIPNLKRKELRKK